MRDPLDRVSNDLKRRKIMKMRAILKVLLTCLVVSGLFVIAANAQPSIKKFAYKIDKRKISFVTPTLDFPAGKIVIGGEVKGVEVSGGSGGCFTVTVTTYRMTPNGEKIPVRSRSKTICKVDRLPEIVVDLIPKGKYLVEVEIDRPLINEGRFEGELTVAIQPEKINLR
jgi:hypothetical protein